MLVIDGVSLAYGRQLILDDFSLSIRAGEIVALSGPSGCGKSTLLRLVAGLLPPMKGTITLGGRPVSAPGVLVPPGQRGLGFVFQDGALFPHLTVEQNVLFGLDTTKGAEAGRLVNPDELFLMLDIDSLRGRYPHELSGGQQQRVALARACAPNPSLLLMDEAFAGLDRFRKHEILPLLSDMLRRRNMTTLVVTHDSEEAVYLADRIVMMEAGAILQSGTAQELEKDPKTRAIASYFSSPWDRPREGTATDSRYSVGTIR